MTSTKTTTKRTTTKSTATATARTKTAKKKVTENQIRKRAEEIYNTRLKTGIPGSADSDWLQAERELLSMN